MSFEGHLNFNLAVAQMRGRRCLDLTIQRGAGLDLVLTPNEGQKTLEDEKRLLQSQVQLERRKLEAEEERLKLEALRLEQEKIKVLFFKYKFFWPFHS